MNSYEKRHRNWVLSNSTFELDSTYKGAHNKIFYKCTKCFNVKNVTPANFKQFPKCTICTKDKIATNYYRYLEINTSIIAIDIYISSKTKILHRCLICEYQWKAQPNHIKNDNSGCPKCANNLRYSIDYIKKAIPQDIQLLSKEYTNCKNKLSFKHINCGHIWQTSLDSILNQQTNCPNCAEYGLNVEKPCYLYLLYFKQLDLYKIGISKNIRTRQSHLTQPSQLLDSVLISTGLQAKNIEKYLLTKYKDYLYNSKVLKSGNTETFKNLPLTKVMQDFEYYKGV